MPIILVNGKQQKQNSNLFSYNTAQELIERVKESSKFLNYIKMYKINVQVHSMV